MERIEELLECSLCSDRFKEPKVLPCQHTYCLRPCLQNIVRDNSVRCPECRASHNLPRNGVEGLPSNFTIVRLLDRQKPRRQCKQGCEIADGDVYNCNHCDESLCGKCIESHTRSLQLDLRLSLIQVSQLVTNLAKSDYYLREGAKKLEENGRNIKREISQSIERFVSELQSRKICLFDKVDALVAMETGSLQREQEELDVNMTALTTHCHIAKEICERPIILSNPEIQDFQSEILCLTQQGREHVQGNGISLDKVRQTIKLTLGDENVVLSAIANIANVSAHAQVTYGGDSTSEGALRGTDCNPWTSERQPGQDSRVTEVLRRYRSKRRVKMCFGMNGSNFGQMNSPHGISSTATDDIVVADTGNHRIQIFDINGQAKGVFGAEGKSAGHFNVVPDVCVTSQGRIVASDFHNDRIQIFDEQGRFTRTFGSKGSGNGQLNKPCGVATDENGLIYVCDFGNGRVQVFTANGQFIRKFGSEENHLNKPSYLSVTSKGRVVVADSGNRLQVFDEYGRHLFQFGTQGTAGIASDHHGNIIVADGCNQRVQVFTSDGTAVSCFGSKGSEPGMMKGPEGVCLLSDGSIAVSDRVNHRVQIF